MLRSAYRALFKAILGKAALSLPKKLPPRNCPPESYFKKATSGKAVLGLDDFHLAVAEMELTVLERSFLGVGVRPLGVFCLLRQLTTRQVPYSRRIRRR